MTKKFKKLEKTLREASPLSKGEIMPQARTPGRDLAKKLDSGSTSELGILDRSKLRRKVSQTQFETARATLDAQLTHWKHEIANQLQAALKRSDLRLYEELERIRKEHLENISVLRIQNLSERSTTIQELNRVATKRMEEAMEQDVPKFMKQKHLKAMQQEYEKVFEQIMSDEILPEEK